MVAACTAGKGIDKVALFVGKIFVVRLSTTKTMNILPHENHPLYNYTVIHFKATPIGFDGRTPCNMYVRHVCPSQSTLYAFN